MPDETASLPTSPIELPSFTLPLANQPMGTALTRTGQRAYGNNLVETDFDDETILKDTDFDSYKGRKGYTDRVGLLTPRVILGRIHFGGEGLGYFLCHSTFARQGNVEICTSAAPCCMRFDAPRKRFSALVIQYNTNQNGDLLTPFAYRLLLWRFSSDKRDLLNDINKEFKLDAHDIRITCQDEGYQKMTIVACKESVWKMPQFQQSKEGATVNAWLQAMTASQGELPSKFVKSVGRKFTTQELAQKMGAAGAVGIVHNEAPVGDIAELIGGLPSV